MSVVRAVVPLQSEAMRLLLKDDWQFFSPGAVDRGDGYSFLDRSFENPSEIIKELADRNITAWVCS